MSFRTRSGGIFALQLVAELLLCRQQSCEDPSLRFGMTMFCFVRSIKPQRDDVGIVPYAFCSIFRRGGVPSPPACHSEQFIAKISSAPGYNYYDKAVGATFGRPETGTSGRPSPTLYYKCVVGAVHEPPVVIPSEGVSLTRNLCTINTQQNYNFAD